MINTIAFRYIAVFASLFFLSKLVGQVDVSMIADSLILNSSVIVINHDETLEIKSKSLLKRRVDSSILITKEIGNDGYIIYIPYDKFTKIDDVKISILTVDGVRKKSIKRSDMIDQSTVDNLTIASDDRVLAYRVIETDLPILVKTEYTKTSKESFSIERIVDRRLLIQPLSKGKQVHVKEINHIELIREAINQTVVLNCNN